MIRPLQFGLTNPFSLSVCIQLGAGETSEGATNCYKFVCIILLDKNKEESNRIMQ